MKRMNKAQLRHYGLAFSILNFMNPNDEIYEFQDRIGANYYDFVDKYGKNVINTDKRTDIIHDMLIPEVIASKLYQNKRYCKQVKSAIALCIEFHDDKHIKHAFKVVLEADFFECDVQDKKGFLEIVYWEIFQEDPALSKYIQGDFAF